MTEDSKPFHNPFASLGGLRDSLPQPVKPAPVPVVTPAPAVSSAKTIPAPSYGWSDPAAAARK